MADEPDTCPACGGTCLYPPGLGEDLRPQLCSDPWHGRKTQGGAMTDTETTGSVIEAAWYVVQKDTPGEYWVWGNETEQDTYHQFAGTYPPLTMTVAAYEEMRIEMAADDERNRPDPEWTPMGWTPRTYPDPWLGLSDVTLWGRPLYLVED